VRGYQHHSGINTNKTTYRSGRKQQQTLLTNIHQHLYQSLGNRMKYGQSNRNNMKTLTTTVTSQPQINNNTNVKKSNKP